MDKWIVDALAEGSRLDLFLVEAYEDTVSRADIQRMIKSQHVLLNDKPTKANIRLKTDDVLQVELLEKVFEIQPIEMNLDVVYEDEHLMVVNKPRDCVVHPSPSTLDRPTLVHGLLAYTDQLSDLNGELRPGIVHRLDKDTSGLLLVAKTNEAHAILVDMLKARDVDREYLALVHHAFDHQQAIVDAPIGRDPKNRQRMAVTEENSKDARTHIFLVENYQDAALLRCVLESGRTHQIRVHLSYIKHPLIGDKTYSYKNTPDHDGQLLHAYKLGFKHPITGEAMSFEVPMPEVMQTAIAELKHV